jgi:hypothetical protein
MLHGQEGIAETWFDRPPEIHGRGGQRELSASDRTRTESRGNYVIIEIEIYGGRRQRFCRDHEATSYFSESVDAHTRLERLLHYCRLLSVWNEILRVRVAISVDLLDDSDLVRMRVPRNPI